MKEHVTEKLSAYLNHELAGGKDERQQIAEHLLRCEKCRSEHDEIKFGVALASQLKQADAPENLWNEINVALDKEKSAKISPIPAFSFFNSRVLAATAAAALLILFGLAAIAYFGLLGNKQKEIAQDETPIKQNTNVAAPQVTSPPLESSTNKDTSAQISSPSSTNVQTLPLPSLSPGKNTNSEMNQSLPKINQAQSPYQPRTTIAQNNPPVSSALSWNVEVLAGAPRAGNQIITAENGKLAVGEFLETDANSRAKIQVANIGQVELQPNSRVRLVRTEATEHRLALERGLMKAKILAPPRLFIVDTPSAVAVDLGCEYTLEVDTAGNSRLHVTAGFVALERGGRESIVPAGAICLTKRGKGLGTPFSDDSSLGLQKALETFDFENGGGAALQTVINEADLYDSLTLWHLLPRVSPRSEREKVFDALSALVKPPKKVTREGIVSRLDKKMLDAWWKEVESVWFE